MKKWILSIVALSIFLVAIFASVGKAAFSPGPLSSAHAFMKDDCQSCHTPGKGVEALSCVPCHATNEALLQRQPTAFHASVSTCGSCHVEHQGTGRRPTNMDHAALARIGLRELAENGEGRKAAAIRKWARDHAGLGKGSRDHPRMTPEEAALNCSTCHATKDKHRGLMGKECATCHSTAKWTIPEFQHPSPRSVECAQCHQPPKSHLMMHFKMVSAKVAKKPKAKMRECYSCHETTAWNDIAGVGWYEHH